MAGLVSAIYDLLLAHQRRECPAESAQIAAPAFVIFDQVLALEPAEILGRDLPLKVLQP
jgi:hypothetical protein